MSLLHFFLFRLGWDICPHCGSKNIMYRGFPGMNARIECLDCGKTETV